MVLVYNIFYIIYYYIFVKPCLLSVAGPPGKRGKRGKKGDTGEPGPAVSIIC